MTEQDSHLFLIDLRLQGVTGKQAERALDEVNITLNKNTVPNETESPFVTSGIRLGTPAITTRGMGKNEMKMIASWIDLAVSNHENDAILLDIRSQVKELCSNFPIYEN